jgi:5-methylcytosine-specific restriction endonuclease McrA
MSESKRVKGSGSKWISRTNRMALYNRDGFTCIWCGSTFSKDGNGLTLDHVVAANNGGTDAPTNLITACLSCNSSKQDKTNRGWFAYLRDNGVDTSNFSAKLAYRLNKDVDTDAGKELALARYGRT